MVYTVFIDENSHYQDRDARYKHGEFETYEQALEASKVIIYEFLLSALAGTRDEKKLFESWSMFGEDPFIVPDEEPGFSAQEYARKTCAELCRR